MKLMALKELNCEGELSRILLKANKRLQHI
jgi:hypothetical protein